LIAIFMLNIKAQPKHSHKINRHEECSMLDKFTSFMDAKDIAYICLVQPCATMI
jgi:hypothetical protein